LLKSIVGVLKLDCGRIVCAGEIGYVPQNSWTPFPYSVFDMVLMGRARNIRMFASPGKADCQAADDALDQLGIQGLKKRIFTTLSGGERQLVIIARALASGCDCLILDEPAAALDFQNQAAILKTLKRLAVEKEMSIVLTTHFPQHAVHIADKALLMYDPQQYTFGSANQILTDERLGRLFKMAVRRIGFRHAGREIHTVVPVFD
jgi:iron complex transport system ATP-binding protein